MADLISLLSSKEESNISRMRGKGNKSVSSGAGSGGQGNATQKNKTCCQCELVFKKTQKSISCSVCNYWFCLDCSHVSVKLYDMLPAESTVNVPFHCDGCVRVVPKLTELGSLVKKQNDKFTEYDAKIEDIQSSLDNKIKQQVEKLLHAYK